MRPVAFSLLLMLLLPPSAFAQQPFNGLTIETQSDLCVTEAEAVEQTSRRLRQLLEQELARRTPLPISVLGPSMPRLMFAVDAQRTQHTESVQRPFGTLYRRHEQLRIPDRVVRDWLSEIEATEHSRTWKQWLAVTGIAVSWLVMLRLFVVFDRRTHGYQRAWLTTCGLTFGCLLTCLWCCLV